MGLKYQIGQRKILAIIAVGIALTSIAIITNDTDTSPSEINQTEQQTQPTNQINQEPGINWLQPTQSTYEDTEIETEIEVFNAVEGAEYRIIENSNTIHTDTLEEDGDTTINQQVEYSQGTQDIHFELDQAEDTFETDTKTIEFGAEQPEPEFTLDSPDGTTIETFDQTTDVEFSYTVEERGWAEQATIVLEDEEGNEIDTYTHSITSDETYNYEFENIPASEEGETYTWTITDEDEEISESTNFDTQIVEPDATLNLVDETELGDGEVEFDYYAESEVNSELEIEIVADESMERTWDQCDGDGNLQEETISYDEGETVTIFSASILGGQTLETGSSETLNIAGDYSWEGEIIADDGKLLDSANPKTFTTTEQPEEDTTNNCIDGDE